MKKNVGQTGVKDTMNIWCSRSRGRMVNWLIVICLSTVIWQFILSTHKCALRATLSRSSYVLLSIMTWHDTNLIFLLILFFFFLQSDPIMCEERWFTMVWLSMELSLRLRLDAVGWYTNLARNLKKNRRKDAFNGAYLLRLAYTLFISVCT